MKIKKPIVLDIEKYFKVYTPEEQDSIYFNFIFTYGKTSDNHLIKDYNFNQERIAKFHLFIQNKEQNQILPPNETTQTEINLFKMMVQFNKQITEEELIKRFII